LYSQKHSLSVRPSEMLNKLNDVMRFHEFGANENLELEDESIQLLYISQGEVKAKFSGDDGQQIHMLTFRVGDFFTATEYFNSSQFSIKTLKNSVIGFVRKIDIDELIRLDHEFAVALVRWYEWYNSLMIMKMRDLLMYGNKGAMASTLMRLVNMHGEECVDGVLINLDITNEEISEFVGVSRETVNRYLQEYRFNNVISIRKRKIIVHDVGFFKREHHCLECISSICHD